MIKKRFISMLVLLLTAATGAWADEVTFSVGELRNSLPSTSVEIPYEWTVESQQPKVTIAKKDGTTGTLSVSGVLPLDANYTMTVSVPTGGSIDGVTFTTNPASMAGNISASTGTYSNGTWTPGEGDVTSVTFTPTGTFRLTQIVVVYTPAPAPAASTYTVTLKEGTEDATNWTITPAEATTTGVAAGTTVTATYSGTKKVKSVKAVKKAAPAPALNLTSPAVGQVIGDDGKNYDYASLPGSVTAVAMIAKVSGTSGLAIALADEEGTMNWDTAVTTAAAHTPTFTGGTWKLPTQAEWKQMFSANGGSETSYSGLNTAIGNAGGTALQEYVAYWSSTENGSDNAYGMFLEDGNAYFGSDGKVLGNRVRPCLAFTVESPAAPTLAETMTTAGMTVKVNFNYSDENYCLFLSNGNGTYTFQSGGGYAGGDGDCAKALVVEDGKLVFKQNYYETIDYEWDNYGFSVTFNTSNNTYSEWKSGFAAELSASFISVEVNGETIAVTAAQ